MRFYFIVISDRIEQATTAAALLLTKAKAKAKKKKETKV